MAIYKYDKYMSKSDSAIFDTIHKPGEPAPHSGIFRCEACGLEITHKNLDPLPPQNHHQHDPSKGEIRWRFIVWG